MFGIGGSEILGIALIALLLFGPSRLPDLARVLARAYRQFLRFRSQMNDAVDDLKADIDIDLEDKPVSSAPQIRAPQGTRVSAAGDDYLAEEQVPELIELEVPAEDDYLSPQHGSGGEETS